WLEVGDEGVGGGVGVEFAGDDLLGEAVKGFAAGHRADAGAEFADRDGLDLADGALGAAGVEFAVVDEPGVVVFDGNHDVVDAGAGGGGAGHDRGAPGWTGDLLAAQGDHVLEVADGVGGAG